MLHMKQNKCMGQHTTHAGKKKPGTHAVQLHLFILSKDVAVLNNCRIKPGRHHVTGGGLWLVVISTKNMGFVKVIGAGLGGMQTMLSLIQGGRKAWWLVVAWDVWKGFWKMEELESPRFFRISDAPPVKNYRIYQRGS